MSVPGGSHFGSYEILSLLDVGGMGQVYRARDTRLGRIVAIKVLPDELTSDTERIERFAREARILATLNHPNIATIHSIEDADGRSGLVMELVDGETLESRLTRQGTGRPLPLTEAVGIARQIAEALDAAHEKSIVHRDLKPANVMITPDGMVKVLDFGLAKVQKAAATSPHTNATLKGAPTEYGTVLGTVPYMSPEQARGVAVDKRTDIWAFGCVLYELLTGWQPFRGETMPDLLAAILERDPDWHALPATTPPSIKRLLQRCLERDPKRRMRDIGDARAELDDVQLAHAATGAPSGAARARGISRAAAAGVLGIALGGLAVWSTFDRAAAPETVPRPRVTRLSIQTPASAPLAASPASGIRPGTAALSPDGSRIVYVAALPEGGRQLYERTLDQSGVRPIAGTEGASAPFFSPDGASIGFFAGGKLKRVPAGGGDVTSICDVPEDTGGSSAVWAADGTIVFAKAVAAREGLFKVSADGGLPEALTQPDPSEGGSHGDPSLIDGRAVLFVVRFANPPALRLKILATGEERTLVETFAFRPLYVPTGHLLFVQGRVLMAAPFDAAQLHMTGPAKPVLENVGIGMLSVSADGRLAYSVPGSSTGRLVWVSRDGAMQPLLPSDRREFGRPRLSRDGGRMLVEVYQGTVSDIHVYGFDNGALTRLTSGGGNSPLWSPDDGGIVFRRGPILFSLPAADPGAEAQPLVTNTNLGVDNPGDLAPGAWTPDGSTYVFVHQGGGATAADIWAMHKTASGQQFEPLVERLRNQWGVRVSPDGRWFSYASDESGQYEIYVQSLEQGGETRLISTGGGWQAVWHPRGGEIFYRADDRMMAVTVTMTPTFSSQAPHELFRGVFASTDIANYDVTEDGQRFVMVQPYDEAEERTIQLVDHWFEELQRVVPVTESR